MKKLVSLALALALILASIATLAACGAPKDDGAEISVYLGERIYDFDPTDYYVDSNAESVMSLLFEPLFSVTAKGKLENAMAKDYKVDEVERTITITLRESYWSDGARVKAEDYVYAWCNVLLNPNNANPAATLLYDIKNAVGIKTGAVESIYDFGAVATELDQLVITYRKGADYNQLLKNLASVATSPIRQDIATEYTSGYWSKIVNSAMSNGPFMIAGINEEDNSFTLVRNVGYHQKPSVTDYDNNVIPGKLVTFLSRFDGEQELSYSDIEKKAVFYMSEASLADRAANKGSAKVADDLSTYSYVFNTDNPLFAIKEVRQALSMAIDRNAIIEAITFGKAANGFLPDAVLDTSTGKTFRTEELISKSAKVVEAKAILDGVSLKDIDTSFTLTIANNEESIAIANIVKAAWESLGHGISVKVETAGVIESEPVADVFVEDCELQILVNRASRGDRDFDVIAVDWQMFSTDAFVALAAFSTKYSGSGVELPYATKHYGSFGGWSNADYDALIEAAYKATDKAERSTALHSAEKLLVEEAAIVPLVYNQSFAFISGDLSGVVADGLGHFSFTKTKQKNYREYID